MKPCNIMQMRATGGGGALVAFPASIGAGSGVYNAEVVFNNDGTWQAYSDGSLENQGTWLLAGTAAEVSVNYHLDAGALATGSAMDTDLSLGTDRSVRIDTNNPTKSSDLTATIKRISDGAVLDYVAIYLYAEGDGGGLVTMTL